MKYKPLRIKVTIKREGEEEEFIQAVYFEVVVDS
jgi:hypothetical protein